MGLGAFCRRPGLPGAESTRVLGLLEALVELAHELLVLALEQPLLVSLHSALLPASLLQAQVLLRAMVVPERVLGEIADGRRRRRIAVL